MIVGWISSETVVSRLYRNTKGIEATYNDDILEWIPEALLKMKTKQSLEVRPCVIQIDHNQGKLPCGIEGLLCVTLNGFKLNYYNNTDGRTEHHPSSLGYSLFRSINPIYTSSGDISAGDEGRSKFPTDVIVAWNMDCDEHNWYKVNGRFIQTSLRCGEITAWVQTIPIDENGYPLVPDNEFVHEAIYRYCRLMLIEAGYEDKIISHERAEMAWNRASIIAINDMTYPTPDQVESSIHRHLDDYFPDGIYTDFR
jgi:hypothetical protein